ncbi:MAG: hypothetical protein JST83_03260 [Bacteroidetes bacterium]|nr:hypothetical protein [Bacteroidota bacterium]
MHKYILASLVALTVASTTYGADLSKEEKKAIKAELKQYKKNPASFKAMMDKNKEDLETAEAAINKNKEQINQLTNDFADAQAKLIERGNQLKECQNKPVPKCPEPTDPLAAPLTGTVYKVQLGLYKKLDINSDFAKPKVVGFEKTEGMNRYVVNYFDSKEEAEHFAGDLRKLGLKGAFVAKYENGERVFEKGKTKKAATTSTTKKSIKKVLKAE